MQYLEKYSSTTQQLAYRACLHLWKIATCRFMCRGLTVNRRKNKVKCRLIRRLSFTVLLPREASLPIEIPNASLPFTPPCTSPHQIQPFPKSHRKYPLISLEPSIELGHSKPIISMVTNVFIHLGCYTVTCGAAPSSGPFIETWSIVIYNSHWRL